MATPSSLRPNGLLQRLWRFLSGQKKESGLTGSQRPAAVTYQHTQQPEWAEEIIEVPIRNRLVARELIEGVAWTKEWSDVLDYATRDTFSSPDGDDIGFTIADTLDDNKTPVDPSVKAILLELIARRNGSDYVIGGTRLKRAIREIVGYGDSFWNIGIAKDGTGSYGVSSSLKLPCWEMFRVEDNQGRLERFEQRRSLHSESAYAVFAPPSIIHFRYNQQGLYGQSIFQRSLQSRARRDRSQANLAKTANDVGANPIVHRMPDGFTPEQKAAYKQAVEERQKDGVITNLYVDNDADARRLSESSGSGSFDSLISYDKGLRSELIPAGFPVWLIPGMDTKGAREISGAPERAYARMRNDWCQALSQGIRQVCDIELVLKLGFDRYLELMKKGGYRIVWPKWTIYDGTAPADDDEANATGIQDLDQDNLKMLYAVSNGNGNSSKH